MTIAMGIEGILVALQVPTVALPNPDQTGFPVHSLIRRRMHLSPIDQRSETERAEATDDMAEARGTTKRFPCPASPPLLSSFPSSSSHVVVVVVVVVIVTASLLQLPPWLFNGNFSLALIARRGLRGLVCERRDSGVVAPTTSRRLQSTAAAGDDDSSPLFFLPSSSISSSAVVAAAPAASTPFAENLRFPSPFVISRRLSSVERRKVMSM